jgi:predicted nucleic acid-binding protein
VRRLLVADVIATSRLSEVEVTSAIIRRGREGVFDVRERDRALQALVADFAALHVVEILPEIVMKARGVLLRHALRAGDAIQLASGLFLQQELGEAIEFVAFDERLRAAARSEGLNLLPKRSRE